MNASLSVAEKCLCPQVSAVTRVAGVGFSVPERVVTNEYFESYLETSDSWIRDRTGIEQRRWTAPEVGASELSEPACRTALKNAGLGPKDIDGIVLGTVTPDYTFPSSACVLQKRLGVSKGPAFDINAACSGFLYALVTADSLISSGQCRHVLVVGVDIYSSIINLQDRGTCVLFGDGAGAMVLSAIEEGGSGFSGPRQRVSGDGATLRGVYSCQLGADGSGSEILCVPNGSAARPTPESLKAGEHFLKMEGREVFKIAVRKLSEISEDVLKGSGFSIEQVDHFATHQANIRIVLSMAKSLGVPRDKILVNVNRYGNTSAASLPILLAESAEKGIIKSGDLILLTAFGAGLTWGGVLLRW